MIHNTSHYDVIVIGVGGMGSATAYHLAGRGRRVLGLDRFSIPHMMGSSHGYTRIIRLAYYEHPSYVPLLKRAYELWRELQAHAGESLLHITGSLDAGPADDWIFKGSLKSCEQHGLPHEVLTNGEITRRYPGYQLPEETMAVFQPNGGFLVPERCIIAHVNAAQARGAEIHGCEPVAGWEPVGDLIKVTTGKAVYTADQIVITAGAWAGKMAGVLQPHLTPERQVLAWLQPKRPEWFQPDRFPVFNLTVPEGRFYGFPVYGIPGFKFGCFHHLEEAVDPDDFDRMSNARDEALLRDFAERHFPDGAGPTMSLLTCMFTNTSDENFILDVHPECPQVFVASPCSGHGFKFCSVVGEIMADLLLDGQTRHDIDLHRLSRLG
jgi:sarcosine oxidase